MSDFAAKSAAEIPAKYPRCTAEADELRIFDPGKTDDFNAAIKMGCQKDCDIYIALTTAQ